MTTLLILWAGQTGHTHALAAAAADAARLAAPAVSVRLLPARSAGLDDLLAADGVLFATPENFGYMAGALKDFFDRTFYPAQGRVEGRPYALLVSAGNDGRGAAGSVERIVRGYALTPIAPPLIVCTHAQTTEAILAAKTVQAADLEKGEELGAAFATGLSMGAF